MASISSANSIFLLTIAGLYNVPQQLQGFAADDIFDNASVQPAEVMMGVDGKLSAGFVFTPVPMTIALQADSDSNALFEAWFAAERAQRDKYFAGGLVTLTSINRSYVLANGVLTSYQTMPDAKKVLQPRRFGITWESVLAAPV